MKLRLLVGLIIAGIFGISIGYAIKVSGNYVYSFAQKSLALINISAISEKIGLGGPLGDQDLEDNQKLNLTSYDEASTLRPNDFDESHEAIPEQGKAIVANLEEMNLYIYEDGSVINTFEILSKGRQGTAWETPPGKYEILSKEENHFSTIGQVWMPYSMQFFGNYFIHGWPYYPDGTPVPEGYSGGCIRMSDESVKEVYEFASLDTPVIIQGSLPTDQKNSASGKYQIGSGKFPRLSAKSYIIADVESGEIIKSYGQKVQYPIASLTKLMTALVSLETLNQYNQTIISSRAVHTYGDQGGLRDGEKTSVSDLIYPLLLESSNDAGEAISETNNRKVFMKNMNKKAGSIGLANTIYEDPSGLSENNLSTTGDLFKLLQYIYKYKNYILEISRLKDYSNDVHHWYSNSKFKNDENYIGGKNGYTDEARHTLIALFDLPLGEAETENRKIAIILLQGEESEKDTRAILRYLLENVYFEKE